MQAVGSCADAEFLISRLKLKRGATQTSCHRDSAGSFPAEVNAQVGRATEVAVCATSGLAVSFP